VLSDLCLQNSRWIARRRRAIEHECTVINFSMVLQQGLNGREFIWLKMSPCLKFRDEVVAS